MAQKTHYIKQLIAEGEHEHQDFKFQISDAKKIARSISAFANHGGGRLLVGVKDNGNIAGVRSDEEIYMVQQAAQMYCRPPQTVTFQVYKVDGKNVVKADIAEAEVKPVKAPDENGEWKAYFRVDDENILATAMHVKLLRRDRNRDKKAAVLQFTEREQLLLNYLAEHGGITISGFMKLAHVSRMVAEAVAVNLCDMGVIKIQYHNATCLLVLNL